MKEKKIKSKKKNCNIVHPLDTTTTSKSRIRFLPNLPQLGSHLYPLFTHRT